MVIRLEKKLLCKVMICSAIALATACSSTDSRRDQIVGARLADIPVIPIETDAETAAPDPQNDASPTAEVSLDELEARYQSALEVASDPGTRRSILIRLADILMLRSEDGLLASDQPAEEQFDQAIGRYRELIELQRDAIEEGDESQETNQQIDQMLYQLSKAYALGGQVDIANEELANLSSEYEDSVYTPEAKFRRAEKAFRDAQYAEAEQLYTEVIAQGGFTPYYQNAIYMVGWTKFKRSQYEDSINAFTRVLDFFYGATAPLKTVPESQKSLAIDTLRVLSLSFNYLDGPATLSEFFGNETERPYVHIVYRALGLLYEEKERYRDSAEAYRQYVFDFPNSDFAPAFSSSVIDIYNNGNFPSLVIPAKEEFVSNYGIDSDYWQQKSPAKLEPLKPQLKQYIEELAKYEHSNAQLAKEKTPQQVAVYTPTFKRAADWYDQFYRTFPQDEKTPEMIFLKGEALNDAGELVAAYDTYNFLAYGYELPESERERGAEAAYSTILLAEEILNRPLAANDTALWQERMIDKSLAFANQYSSDPRAPSVLNRAAQTLLTLERQPEAIQAATKLVNWQPIPASQTLKEGWLVLGQSEFDLSNYQNADEAYGQALAFIPQSDSLYRSVLDRRSASIYQLALQLKEQDQVATAVDQFLRIQSLAPDTPIAITAQYDAGNELMGLESWQQAEVVFLNFRRRYPDHELINTIYPKMVVIYQETEQWILAGDELTAMANSSNDPEVQRQSLLLGAELYDRSQQYSLAASNYQTYIQRYPDPFDDQVEAVAKLSDLYKRRQDNSQFEFWQRELIAKHDQAGSRQTDRSLYLASSAQNYFAEKNFDVYRSQRLTLPIKQSLAVKQQSLKQTVDAYQKLIDYGVVEFVTKGNFYIAEVYSQLSKDLIDSERPRGLDDLALEQYEILLEDQAYPFEEKAIEIHESNIKRTQNNIYDTWVKESFAALANLFPGRYRKNETRGVNRELY